jgi:preprotein translocase subunit SecG
VLITLGLAMWIKGLLGVGFLFVCIVLILTVLIQRPSGGGLSGAFGSASGSGQTAFGAKTGDALTIFTIIMFVIFVLGGIGMKFVTNPTGPPQPAGISSGEPAPAPGASDPAPAPVEAPPAAGETGQGAAGAPEPDPAPASPETAPTETPPGDSTPAGDPPAGGEPGAG